MSGPDLTLVEGLRRLAAESPLTVTVTGHSMEPCLPPGSVVEVRPAPRYWPGDVLAFRDHRERFTTHRLIGYLPGRGGLRLVTQGDARRAPDRPLAPERILGRVRGGDCPRRVSRVPLVDRIAALYRFLRYGLLRLARPLRG